MRKRLMILALVLIAVLMTCTLAACSGGGGRCSGGHTWDEGTVKEAATCLESGTLINKCTVCGIKREVTIEALGHDLHVLESTVIAPTCEVDGYAGKKACVREGCEYVLDTGTIIPAIGHAYGDWISNGDGTHKRVCSNDSKHVESGNCSGGTADCGHKAVCDVCGGEYGDFASSHVFDKQVTTDVYKASDATCEAKATYYYSCQCGEKGTETFEYGDYSDHVFDREVAEAEYLVSEATCTSPAIYNKSCACGLEGTETFEYGDALPHTFDKQEATDAYKATDATCTAKATYYYSCDCGAHGTATFAYGDMLDHVYDKEVAEDKYLASAATCEKKATYYKSCYCGHFDSAVSATFESGELGDHVYDNKVANETYKATDATCTAKATYYFSCDCGKAGTETFESGETLPHVYDKEIAEDKYLKFAANCASAAVYYKSCACGHFDAETSPTFYFGAPSGNHVFDREFAIDDYKATEATCTAKATYYYSCECGEKGTTTFESGATLDHTMTYHAAVDATCISTGNVEYWTCSTCSLNYDSATGGNVIDDVTTAVDATNHVHTTISKPAVDPDCENTGLTAEISCADCHKVLEEREEIPALGHKGGTATCKDKAVCEVCGEAYGELANHTPGEIKVENNVAPSCTAEGSYDNVVYCSVCDHELSRETITTDALEHAYGEWVSNSNDTHSRVCGNDNSHVETDNCSGGAATLTEKAICSVCGEAYGETLTLPTAPVTVSTIIGEYAAANGWGNETNHLSISLDSFMKVSATGGTYTGRYYTSNGSWRIYQNESPVITFETAYDNIQIVSIKIEYSIKNSGVLIFGEASVRSKDVVVVNQKSAVFSVGNSGNKTNGNIQITSIEVVYEALCSHNNKVSREQIDATCEAQGITAGTYCFDCNKYLDGGHIIEALGHKAETVAGKDATCTETGLTEGKHCSVCDKVLVAQEEIKALGHDYESKVTAPTCTADGYTTHTCSVCGDTYKDNETSATGHTEETIPAVAPGCESEGLTEGKKCSVCGEILTAQQTISATGHTEVTDAAVEATCTTAGKTEGKHCSVCDKVLVAQTAVPAKGHTEKAPAKENIVDATCEADGSYEMNVYCATCGELLSSQKYTTDKLGHNYVSTVTKDPTCTETGVRTYTCQNDNSHTYTEVIEKLSHTPAEAVVENRVEATCTKEGSYDSVVKCSACGEELSREAKTIDKVAHSSVEIPAVAPTCTEKGKTAGAKCSVCGEILVAQEDIAANGHTEVIDDAVAATCTETGLTEGKHCSVCNEVLVEQTVADALGHEWEWVIDTSATVTSTGLKHEECTRCDATQSHNTVIDILVCAHTDTLVHNEKVDADCENAGSIEYWHCTACGKNYSDENGQIAVENIIIPATGHNYNSVVTAPTCTADGYTTHTCANCDDTYTDTIGDALGHTEVIDNAVAATCTATGLTEGKHCSVCNEVLVAQEVVKALDHSWVETSRTEATCVATGAINFVCEHDNSHTKTETIEINANAHDLVERDAKAPTCNEIGWDAYEECSRCDYTTYVEKSALGHNEVEHEAQAPTCEAIGWDAYVTCSRCDYTTYAEKAKLGHDYVAGNVVAPGCETDGYTIYNCSRCDATENRDIVSALGHTEVVDVAIAPTCTATGLTEGKHCSVCEKVLVAQDVVVATGHTEVTDDAVDATCTTAGKTEGKHCSVCGTVTKAQESIDALGHDEISHVAQAPTCTEVGWEAYVTCSRCDYTTYKEISATGHIEVEIPAVEATCTETGLTEGKHCSVCGEITVARQEVALKAHTYVEGAGICSVCGANESINIILDFTKQSYENQQVVASLEVDDVVVTFDKDNSTNTTKYFTTGAAIRVYGGGYFVVSAKVAIAKIELTFGTGDGDNDVFVDVGSFDVESNIWTGSSKSVKFSIDGTSGHRRIQKITVYCSLEKACETCTATQFDHNENYHWNVCTICSFKHSLETHTFDKMVATDDYKATDATCTAKATYYYSCECGLKGTETFESGELLEHKYDQEVAEEKYLATPATCSTPATYYKSCVCGEKGTDVFEHGTVVDHKDDGNGNCVYCGNPMCANHELTNWVDNGDNHTGTCASCLKSETLPHEHTAGTPVNATCTTDGYTPYTCVCGNTENRDEIAATGHSGQNYQIEANQHKYVCGVCGEVLSSGAHEANDNGFCVCGKQLYQVYSYTFTSKQYSANETKALGALDWTLVAVGNGAFGYDGSSGRGQQFGTKASPFTSITLTSTNLTGVTKVVINAAGASGTDAVITVTVGGVSIGNVNGYGLTSSATEYSFDCEATSGEVAIIMAQTSSVAMYIKSITIHYAAPCEHKHTESRAAVESTCTKQGTAEGTFCTDCQSYVSGGESLPLIDHSYGDWYDVINVTCTTNGSKTHKCSVCEFTETITTNATGHTETSEVTKDATCYQEGVKTYTCSTCNATRTESIPATNEHTYVNGKCTTEGCTATENEGGGSTEEPELTQYVDNFAIKSTEGTLNNKTITWTTASGLTIEGAQAGSTTAIRIADSDHYRVYKGSTLKIKAEGRKITKVVITITESKYVTPCVNSVTTPNAEVTTNGTVVTIVFTEGVEVVEFSASDQFRVKNIETTYLG